MLQSITNSVVETLISVAQSRPLVAVTLTVAVVAVADYRFDLGVGERAGQKVADAVRANTRWIVLLVGGFVAGRLLGRFHAVQKLFGAIADAVPVV